MIDRPLAELLRGLRSRQIRSRTLVDALLERLELLDPRLHLTLLRRDAEVRKEADEADLRLDQGAPRGPLEGLPVTIKDCLDTAGIRTTSGCLHRRSRVPTEDALTVGRWRNAGALVLAKSNAPELAFSLETDNLLVGRTRNPWSPSRTVGGSSGGEAAMLATGCSLLGLGSDFGGSLRLPAHFCGVVSLKPTAGALPNHGHPPPVPDFMQPLAVIGPLARNIADLAIGWAALREDHALLEALIQDPSAALASPSATLEPGTIRVVFSDDPRLSPATRQILNQAAETLRARGHLVEKAEVPALAEAERLWERIVVCDGGNGVRELAADGHPLSLAGEVLRHLVGRGRRSTNLLIADLLARGWEVTSLEAVNAERLEGLERLRPLCGSGDAFLLPVTPDVAHRAFNRGAMRLLSPFVRGANVYGLPALTVPIRRGAPGVLPIAVQLMGGPDTELELLRLGWQLETAGHQTQRQPGSEGASLALPPGQT